MKISDRNDRINEIPAALMAVSSLLSPRLPKVMSEESRMAKGKACGTIINPMYQKNCARISIDKPLPIKSSIYRHRNCIISTNWQMKKVPKNSNPNCLVIKMSSFFILSILAIRAVSYGIQARQRAKLVQKNKICAYERLFIKRPFPCALCNH